MLRKTAGQRTEENKEIIFKWSVFMLHVKTPTTITRTGHCSRQKLYIFESLMFYTLMDKHLPFKYLLTITTGPQGRPSRGPALAGRGR